MAVELSALAVIVCGAVFTADAGITTFQLPEASGEAVKVPVFQLTFTLMVIPYSDFPHMINGLSRCTTILLWSTFDKENLLVEGFDGDCVDTGL